MSGSMQGPGGALGKDEFLKLLVAQLRHQDPLNPADGQEFAAQLAQFTSVEQLMQINQSLGNQNAGYASMINSMNASAAMATIGKTVVAAGDFLVADGSKPAEAIFEVAGDGGRGILTVKNEAGDVVATRDLGVIDGGRHTTVFDGDDALPDGEYTYSVAVTGAEGAAVDVITYTTVQITGVSTGATGITLTAGELAIPFGSILEVRG